MHEEKRQQHVHVLQLLFRNSNSCGVLQLMLARLLILYNALHRLQQSRHSVGALDQNLFLRILHRLKILEDGRVRRLEFQLLLWLAIAVADDHDHTPQALAEIGPILAAVHLLVPHSGDGKIILKSCETPTNAQPSTLGHKKLPAKCNKIVIVLLIPFHKRPPVNVTDQSSAVGAEDVKPADGLTKRPYHQGRNYLFCLR
mmetsp:Transcript_21627/g.49265  ORF Transcript_21627/g.49265 Transcript_21627/m.49265 type:complete len:200 (+) Transcript_21627:76-675(+)